MSDFINQVRRVYDNEFDLNRALEKYIDELEVKLHDKEIALRDEFAGKAMQALMDGQMRTCGNGSFGFVAAERIAKDSFQMADAMIAERNK